MIVHDLDNPMRVPREIAKCPYCDRTLVITDIEEWALDPDGGKIVEDFGDGMGCISEPDNDSSKFERWLYEHTYMPYVYWMPVANKVLEWAQENVRFVSSTDDRRKYQKWVQAIAGPQDHHETREEN